MLYVIWYTFLSLQGETGLHLACEKGLLKLTEILLDKGANPNSQTLKPSHSATEQLTFDGELPPVSQQTPLHLALVHRHSDIVEIFLQHKGKCYTSSLVPLSSVNSGIISCIYYCDFPHHFFKKMLNNHVTLMTENGWLFKAKGQVKKITYTSILF